MDEGIETLIIEHVAAMDEQRHLDAQRRREVQARHALMYPASLQRDAYAATFMAVRPVDGQGIPCKIELRKHGIEGGLGLYVNPFDTSAVELEEVEITHRFPLQPLDRAYALRLFGLAGHGQGDLVDELGTTLASAWAAEGLGPHMDAGELALTARSWEADRLDRSGRAEFRGMLPSRFAEAAALLAMPDMAKRLMFGHYAINVLSRDEAFCDLAAALGGLAPLLLERPQAFDLSTFGTPAEFVQEVMRTTLPPDGRAVTLAEAGWLHLTFADFPAAMVTEPLAAILVAYRRALAFKDLGEADQEALRELIALSAPLRPDDACRNLFGLMGDLGAPHGMPAAFLSGVERHREASGGATGPLLSLLSTDACDLADAVWNAVGFRAAKAVSDLREPGILPMLLWDVRDPAVNVFMYGVNRMAAAATYRGNGSEGLLEAAELWLRAGRPGHEAGKLGGIGRRRRFKEIETAKGKAGADCDALIGFIEDGLGVDLEPAWMALARKVAAMGTETHERWLRQDYLEPASVEPLDDAVPVADVATTVPIRNQATDLSSEAPAQERTGSDVGSDEPDMESPAPPASWWKRAATLGQTLAAKRNG